MLSRNAPLTADISSGAEGAANGVAAQRQRQASHFLPPSAEIDDAVQAGLVVSQLAFVNDQSGFVFAFEHLRNDLIEGHDFRFHSGSKELQRQIGGRERARNGDAFLFDLTLAVNGRGETIIGP